MTFWLFMLPYAIQLSFTFRKVVFCCGNKSFGVYCSILLLSNGLNLMRSFAEIANIWPIWCTWTIPFEFNGRSRESSFWFWFSHLSNLRYNSMHKDQLYSLFMSFSLYFVYSLTSLQRDLSTIFVSFSPIILRRLVFVTFKNTKWSMEIIII